MTASPFILQARPAPPPRPVVTYHRGNNGAYNPNRPTGITTVVTQRQMGSVPSPIPSVVVCDYCDTVMTVHQVTPLLHQCVCDTCGVSGPRRVTADFALAAAFRLFKK